MFMQGFALKQGPPLKRIVKKIKSELVDRALFLREFLKRPFQVAYIVPSSRFVERRIVEMAEIRPAQTVVELGAGTGGTTRAILNAMAPDAKLLVIEINPRLCERVSRIKDARLIVHCGCAHELESALAAYGLSAPEVVISGIPFSTINRVIGLQILDTISAMLIPGGRFVAYQIRDQVNALTRPLLGAAQVEVEYFNFPPVRLYRWEKCTPERAAATPSRQ